jgi:hypothetical protein
LPRGYPSTRHSDSIRRPRSPRPTMFKLFSFTLAILSLIVAVQCGIPACPSTPTGPKPSSHNARGSICAFKCPESDVDGNKLSSSIHDTARLNCRYTTSSTTGIQVACVYNKVLGNQIFLESSSTDLVPSVHWRVAYQRWQFQLSCVCSLLLPPNRHDERQETQQH